MFTYTSTNTHFIKLTSGVVAPSCPESAYDVVSTTCSKSARDIVSPPSSKPAYDVVSPPVFSQPTSQPIYDVVSTLTTCSKSARDIVSPPGSKSAYDVGSPPCFKSTCDIVSTCDVVSTSRWVAFMACHQFVPTNSPCPTCTQCLADPLTPWPPALGTQRQLPWACTAKPPLGHGESGWRRIAAAAYARLRVRRAGGGRAASVKDKIFGGGIS